MSLGIFSLVACLLHVITVTNCEPLTTLSGIDRHFLFSAFGEGLVQGYLIRCSLGPHFKTMNVSWAAHLQRSDANVLIHRLIYGHIF